MADQEGAQERRALAEPEDSPEGRYGDRVLDGPHWIKDRPPLPIEQEQHEAGEQHVSATFDGGWYEACPPAFEALARHHTVLDGEQAEQQHVDDQRLGDRAWLRSEE